MSRSNKPQQTLSNQGQDWYCETEAENSRMSSQQERQEAETPNPPQNQKRNSRIRLLTRSYAVREGSSPPRDPNALNNNYLPNNNTDKESQPVDSTTDPGVNASQSLGPDYLFVDQTGVCLEDFIRYELVPLHESHKHALCTFERDLVLFVKDTQLESITFPYLSPLNRKFLHKLAASFGLIHVLDKIGRLTVHRTPFTCIPSIPVAAYFQNAEQNAAIRPSQKSILKRGSAASNEEPSCSMQHNENFPRHHQNETEPVMPPPPPRNEPAKPFKGRKQPLIKNESYEGSQQLKANSMRPQMERSYSFGGYDTGSSLQYHHHGNNNNMLSQASSGYISQGQMTGSINLLNSSPPVGPSESPQGPAMLTNYSREMGYHTSTPTRPSDLCATCGRCLHTPNVSPLPYSSERSTPTGERHASPINQSHYQRPLLDVHNQSDGHRTMTTPRNNMKVVKIEERRYLINSDVADHLERNLRLKYALKEDGTRATPTDLPAPESRPVYMTGQHPIFVSDDISSIHRQQINMFLRRRGLIDPESPYPVIVSTPSLSTPTRQSGGMAHPQGLQGQFSAPAPNNSLQANMYLPFLRSHNYVRCPPPPPPTLPPPPPPPVNRNLPYSNGDYQYQINPANPNMPIHGSQGYIMNAPPPPRNDNPVPPQMHLNSIITGIDGFHIGTIRSNNITIPQPSPPRQMDPYNQYDPNLLNHHNMENPGYFNPGNGN